MKQDKNNNISQHHETIKPLVHGIAGAGAGGISAFITCPLDVVKTLLQVQPRKGVLRYKNSFDTLKIILKEEGIRGYYKGLGAMMFALIPQYAIYFFTYNELKRLALKNGYKEGPMVHMFSAIITAGFTDICINPLWVVKTRIQTQKIESLEINKYNSIFGTLKIIVKEEGFQALWKGLTPQLIGVSHVAIQFPLYEKLKKYFIIKKRKQKYTIENFKQPLDSLYPQCNSYDLSSFEILIAASLSKLGASILCYPHEVLRARLQYQKSNDPKRYKNLKDAIIRISQEEGFKGFYRGMGVNLIRVVPTTAITFSTYEFLYKHIPF